MGDIALDTNIAAANSAAKEIMNGNEAKKSSAGPSILVPGAMGAGRTPMKDYNEINVLEMESMKEAKLESWIAKTVGTELMNRYPNRQWGVKVDLRGQMIVVMCPSVSQLYGYHISMQYRSLKDLVSEAARAAGEILERYNLSRDRKFDPEQIEELDRDIRDEVISPDSAGVNPLKIKES